MTWNTNNTGNFFSKPERTTALLLFAVLWIYLLLRAIYVPLLHDELATFFYYVQSDVYLPPHAHWDANNHLLNSMFANWSYHLFGQSPLALRLPNVLSYALYFAGAYGLSSRLKTPFLRWGLLTSLVMCAYIFEYLGESRGYGMALSFLLMALFSVIRLMETKKHGYVLLAGFLMLCATTSNLTLLISSVLIFGWMFVHTIFTDLVKNWKTAALKFSWMLITGIPFLLLVKLSFKLKELGLLYYGSKAGFTVITLPSLLKQFLGSDSAALMTIMLIVTGLIFITGIFLLIQKRHTIGLLLTLYLLIGSVSCIFLLAYFLEVNYPEDRTAMYLYIYFITAFLFMLDALSVKHKFFQWTGVWVFIIPFIFLSRLSLTGSGFSPEERHSQKIFDIINQKPSDFKFPATVGGYITQELCWYYMNNTAGGKQGRLHWTNHPGLDADFQLVSTDFRFNPLTYHYYDSLYRDKATGLVLFERKNKLPKNLLSVTDVADIENTATGFYNLGKYQLDTLRNQTLFVGVEMTLDSPEIPFNARLVAGVDNAAGENVVYEAVSLHWLRKQYSGEKNNVLQGTLIHDVPDDAVSLTFYLWNIKEKPFSIRDGKCYLYSLKRDF